MRRGGTMRRAWQLFVVAWACLGVMAVPLGAQTDAVFLLTLTAHDEPPNLQVSVSANIAGGTRVRVTISPEGGATRELFSSRVGDGWSRLLPADPCDLGGSDLPGAQFAARIEAATGDSLDLDLVLSPDSTKPRFLEPPFESSPRPGAKVEPGDEIGFEVTATDKTPARTWQTGVHTLTVSGPRGEIKSKSGGRRPKPCARKSQSLTASGSYRVRDSDPAVIELCAVAVDYVPNETKKCAKWYKGEVWEGTMNTTLTQVGDVNPEACPGPDKIEGTASFVVKANGKVTGTYDVTGCSVSQPHAEFTGTVTDEGFSFPQVIVQTNGELIPKVSPKLAQATLTNFQDGGTGSGTRYVTKWDMSCVSC